MERQGFNIAIILIPTIVLLLAAAVASAFLLGWFSSGDNGYEPDEVPGHYNDYPNGTDNGDEPDNGDNGANGTSNDGIIITPTEAPFTPALTLKERYDRIVWLDARGGGADGGISGVLDGTTFWEKDISLQIVHKVYELFGESDSGIRAFMVRSTDVLIRGEQRPAMWNGNADMVVSVRLNTFPYAPTAAGLSVDFLPERMETRGSTSRIDISDQQLAALIRGEVLTQTGAHGREAITTQQLHIFALSDVPVALLTAGFMSNEEELTNLTDAEYQWSIAQGIYNGIVGAFRFPRVVTE